MIIKKSKPKINCWNKTLLMQNIPALACLGLNTMPADALATQGPRASTDIVLTVWERQQNVNASLKQFCMFRVNIFLITLQVAELPSTVPSYQRKSCPGHHWFRLWLGATQATSHYLNQWRAWQSMNAVNLWWQSGSIWHLGICSHK